MRAELPDLTLRKYYGTDVLIYSDDPSVPHHILIWINNGSGPSER